MKQHTGFVYLWYDRKKRWFCIGSHFGTTDDGYVTSTGFMKKAYDKRPEDFKRRVLEYFFETDHNELFKLEQKWLDKIKDNELCIAVNKKAKTVRYYNMKKAAKGLRGIFASELRKQYWASEKGIEHKKRLSEETKKRNAERKGKGIPSWNSGKKCPSISAGRKANPTVYSEEYFKKNSERVKALWQNPEYVEKMKNRKKPDHSKIAEKIRGQKRSEETKQKQSEALRGKAKSEEHRKALSLAAKERTKRMLTCPHCNFIGQGPVMNRWHFSNCKIAKI